MKKILSFIALCLLCFSTMAQQLSNTTFTPLPFGTYTATTVNSIDQVNYNYRGAHIIINVTTATSGNYTPHIQAKDPVSGLYYDLLVGTAISSAGVTVLKIYPGMTATANVSASDMLPLTWRVQMIGASTPSAVFSVSAFLGL